VLRTNTDLDPLAAMPRKATCRCLGLPATLTLSARIAFQQTPE
jgi:hypothetical protein